MRLTTSTDQVIIGANTGTGKVNIISTTEQLRLGYDVTHYAQFTVAATGRLSLKLQPDNFTYLHFSSTDGTSTYLGQSAGNTSGTGGANIGIGGYSLRVVSTGTYNLALGYNSQYSLTDGIYNASLGPSSLFSNVHGQFNSALGPEAGYSSTGDRSVYLGFRAGYYSTASDKLFIANTHLATLIEGDFAAGRVGINVTPLSAFHVQSTTEQLRLGYDVSNYFSTTVSATGGVTFNAVGSGAGFSFTDPVTEELDGIVAPGTSGVGVPVIGSNIVSGNLLLNSTAAQNTVQEMSPSVQLKHYSWNLTSGASEENSWYMTNWGFRTAGTAGGVLAFTVSLPSSGIIRTPFVIDEQGRTAIGYTKSQGGGYYGFAGENLATYGIFLCQNTVIGWPDNSITSTLRVTGNVTLDGAGNSVGTITTGVWHGTAITDTYLATISTAGKVSGSAITSGTIGGSTVITTTGVITVNDSSEARVVNLVNPTTSTGGSPTKSSPVLALTNHSYSSGDIVSSWLIQNQAFFTTGGGSVLKFGIDRAGYATQWPLALDEVGRIWMGNFSGQNCTAKLTILNPLVDQLWVAYDTSHYLRIVVASDGAATIDAVGAGASVTFSDAIKIGNTVNAVSPTSPNRTITMVVGGTTLYIPAKTTND